MLADGRMALGESLLTAAGAFGAVSASSGFYLLGHGLCQGTFPFEIPLCETRVLFRRASFIHESSIREKSVGVYSV
jgi:hypothetical protein